MSVDTTQLEEDVDEMTLSDSSAAPDTPPPTPWTTSEAKLKNFEALKQMAFGNCRLLYGSERMKFYDIVLGVDEDGMTFCVALVCSREMESKILRTSVSDCPVKAIHTMVSQLQKDTMPLLMYYGAGSQLSGQQGYTNDETEAFELAENKRITKPEGAVDDTETLPGRKVDSYVPNGAPRGPRRDRTGYKRPRFDDSRMADARMAATRVSEDRIDDNFYG